MDAALLMLLQTGESMRSQRRLLRFLRFQYQPEWVWNWIRMTPLRSRSAGAHRVSFHRHHQLSKLTPMVEAWFLPAKMPHDEIEVTLGSLALSAAARAASFQRA